MTIKDAFFKPREDEVSITDLSKIATWTQKKSNSNRLAKAMMDSYDMYQTKDKKRLDRMELNYELHAGSWRDINKESASFGWSIGGETVTTPNKEIRHYPIINQISHAIVGEMLIRSFIPMVVDKSTRAVNQRKRAKAERLSLYFQKNVVDPLRDQVQQEIAAKYQEQFQGQMPPEAAQQAQQELESGVAQLTPDEIKSYMSSYRPPEEIQAQQLVDYETKRLGIEAIRDEAWEHAVCVSESYIGIGIRNGKPFCELFHPKNCEWEGSEYTTNVDESEFFKHTQYLTWSSVLDRHGYNLEVKDVKSLQKLYCNPGGKSPASTSRIEMVRLTEENPWMDSVDYKTRDGQQILLGLQAAATRKESQGLRIREVYVTWAWNRKIKVVTRIDPATGKKEEFFRDENYEQSAFNGDIKIREIVLKEIWQGYKLGNDANAVYVGVEPVPYQYSSINDPFSPSLPVYGGYYNTIQNQNRNTSLMDLGARFQYRFNVLMNKIEDYEATDIGKVLLGHINMKPPNWSWDEFFKSIIHGRIVLLNTPDGNPNAADANYFRSIDLSTSTDIGKTLEQLQWIKNEMVSSMYYNPSKLGNVSPYITASANNQNIAGSDKQLMKMIKRHKEIMERMMNGLVNVARVAYKGNTEKRLLILDDFSRAELELDTEMISRVEMGLFIIDDAKEEQKLDLLRQNLLGIIQNRMGSMSDIIKIINARSISELITVGDEADKRISLQQQQAGQAAKAESEAMVQQQLQAIEFKAQLDAQKQQQMDRTKIEVANITSDQLAKQWDIDNNNVNDNLQAKLMDNEIRVHLQQSQLEFDAMELATKTKLEKERLRVDMERYKKMNQRTNKPKRP